MNKVIISEEELVNLLNKINLLISNPDNIAARVLAKCSVDTLRGYCPSEVEKERALQEAALILKH
jgi:hypothetical protein